MTDETRSETEIRADLAWVDREGPGSARMGCERLAADVPGLLAKLAGTDWMRKAEALRAERDALRRQLEAVEAAVDAAEDGEYATKGRDFGRGVAYLAATVRAALAAASVSPGPVTATPTHNHITRDIKPRGECPGCDRYHDSAATATPTEAGDERS